MTDSEIEFLAAVKEAIKSGDAQDIGSAVSDFSSFTFKDAAIATEIPPFSDAFVDALLNLVVTPLFLEMEDSFRLLALFQNDWARFNSTQRERVVAQLESHFSVFQDHTSQLVIAELLGEYVADSRALRSLDRLRSVSNETARAHIVHGYGLLARYSADQAVKAIAMTRLREMSIDRSPVVAQEVASVLSHLGNR